MAIPISSRFTGMDRLFSVILTATDTKEPIVLQFYAIKGQCLNLVSGNGKAALINPQSSPATWISSW